LPISRALKKRAAPQHDGVACKQASEPNNKSTDVLQSASQLAQGQDGRTMAANTHGATARAAKRAKQAVASVASTDDADGLVRAVPQHRARKAPAGTLNGTSRPAGKAHATGKASPAAAMVSQPRDNPARSSAEAQQSQHEPVSRRSLRPCQAHATAVVDSSSEHDSNISNFVDDSSDADSAAELSKGASRRERVNKAGMNASKVVCASKRQTSASAGSSGGKARRQHVSSTDEEADTALPETAVCDSEAVDGGTDEVLGESSEEEVARPGNGARLPAKNGFRKRASAQQAKQQATVGAAGLVQQRRLQMHSHKTELCRSNLKASRFTRRC